MDEPARLACPRCELVYRLKKLTPGKTYSCRSCGGPLVPADAVAPGEAGNAGGASAPPRSDYDNSGDVARGRASIAAGLAPESDLSRLPKMIELLTQRIDAVKGLELANDEDGPAARLLRMNERLENDLREFSEAINNRLNELDEKVTADVGGEMKKTLGELDEKLTAALDGNAREMHEELGRRLDALDEKLNDRLAGLDERAMASSGGLAELRGAFGAHSEALINRLSENLEAQKRELDAHRENQKRELDAHREAQRQTIDALLAPAETPAANTTVEVDIDELADRLVAGVRGHGQFLDPDSGSAVDAMARLADELVKEQSANSARLDKLADEIRAATAGISKLEEWRGELPERVADEIGQTVEARVVGPISDTLTRQAPAILSEFHDNKLVDLVSRSVREAQRPLLREILAGGRRGVPLWLFASVLLPLLLILGYLFLPGELGFGGRDNRPIQEEAMESLARIESGMNVVADNEDRLRSIEELSLEIHSEALAHAKNSGGLEEEIKNLKALLAARDEELVKYKETLQTQMKRLRENEMRLIQLGVSPSSVGE